MNKVNLSATLLATILILSGCQKDVLQSARDTMLSNLKGNVKEISLKQYRATQKENGKDFIMGKLIEHKKYVYSPDGMLLTEKTFDANSTLVESFENRYETKGNVTTITSEAGTEVVTRDLERGTRTRTFKDPSGKVIETYQAKIDAKALPLEINVFGPDGRQTRRSLWERDVHGYVTKHEEYVGNTLVYRITATLNKSGDPTNEVETNAVDTIATRAFLYNYDGKGNWIRRVTRNMPKNGKPYYTLSERAIIYY